MHNLTSTLRQLIVPVLFAAVAGVVVALLVGEWILKESGAKSANPCPEFLIFLNVLIHLILLIHLIHLILPSPLQTTLPSIWRTVRFISGKWRAPTVTNQN